MCDMVGVRLDVAARASGYDALTEKELEAVAC
jgi:hypothetical protein